MAAHFRDELLHGADHTDSHLNQNRWRHEESSSFRRHASPRRAEAAHGDSKDLADFLNKTRIDSATTPASAGRHTPLVVAGNGHGANGNGAVDKHQEGHPLAEAVSEGVTEGMEVKCGPLLNYRRMEDEIWFGSILIVVGGAQVVENFVPELKLRSRERLLPSESVSKAIENGSTGEQHNGAPDVVINGVDYTNGNEDEKQAPNTSNGASHTNGSGVWSGDEIKSRGTKLYSDPVNTFWRFDLEVPMQQYELECEYTIPGLKFAEGTKKLDRNSFFIPAISESMRIMFHSCNGFSVGTDEAAWSGPCLWNDVQRVHKITPFHVMLGGGDQIYNDGIRVSGPLRPWSDIGIPAKRRHHQFPDTLRKDCDEYYYKNYIRWYSTEPFATANGQIPQVNLWDDHDIIDGFGSYVDEFMQCPVFRGIGAVAHKYYLLFQHHLAPPISTFTTDAPQTMSEEGSLPDPRQLEDTYVYQEGKIDSSYIIGPKPGPYVAEHSRSIYARLGARIAFFGLDARTERTRKQVNYPETYDIIFGRIREELGKAASSPSPIHHLVVLLGIPIAYPRLTWLENIFSSPLMGPLKFMNKRFGFGGGFFNHFDGSVDLLDDLDDHYTARTHKKERLYLVHQLQAIAAEFSVRVSILGGDVHLAAVGRFYSNPKLNIPVANDHRYMANIISSAIVNKPPPQAVANLLARRNKIHHLDHNTDETLMKFFDRDPGETSKTSNSNNVTMPSRNWAMITENSMMRSAHNGINGHAPPSSSGGESWPIKSIPKAKDGHSWLHKGEVDAGTKHKSADAQMHGKDADGGLDVAIRVEKDQHDPEGRTQSYGMTIPMLRYEGAAEESLSKLDAVPGTVNENIKTAA